MNVFEQARQIGVELKNSELFTDLERAREAVLADREAQELIQHYSELEDQIRTVMTETPNANIQQLVEEYRQAQEKIEGSIVLNRFKDAQAQANEVVAQINRIILHQLGMDYDDGQGGCSGDCAGCSSCG